MIQSSIVSLLTGVFICALQIHLDVKMLPGSNSKVLVVKEALAFQATSVIFDK